MARHDTIADEVIKRCERAYAKQNSIEALEDALQLCASWDIPKKPWMLKALAEREEARILGKPRKKKPGPHTDFLRNLDLWAEIDARREQVPLHNAIMETLEKLKREGVHTLTYWALSKIYKDFRKLLASGEYVPKFSAGLSPKRQGKS